jgi:hypothetical protein
MIVNPAAVLPEGSLQALDYVFSRLFANDEDKMRRAHDQFTKYWDEVGPFGEIIRKFRADTRRFMVHDQKKTPAEDLAKMGPLQKCVHELKMQPVGEHEAVIPFFNTHAMAFAPELCYVLECIGSITAGCVRVERSVKVQKMIHSKLRNRLLHSKVTKLVQIYMNARLGKKMGSSITALEDMVEAENEDEMEVILEGMVDEAIEATQASEPPDDGAEVTAVV